MVLDASVLIAHLESTDALHPRATQLLLGTADDQLAVSPLTMAEILVGPTRSGQLPEVRRALVLLDVKLVPLTEESPVRLASLRVTTRLRLPDCCVLLAGESAGAAVATFDDRLAEAARGLGLDVRVT